MAEPTRFKTPALTALLLLAALALCAMPAAAHPMGNFAICHYAAIRAHRDAVRIHYIIDIAEVPAYRMLRENNVDADGDKKHSEREIEAYRPGVVAALIPGLLVEADGKKLELVEKSSLLEVRDGLPGLKTIWVEIELEAPIDYSGWGAMEVRYKDNNYPDNGGWKEIRLFGSENTRIIKSTEISDKDSEALSVYPDQLQNDPPLDLEVAFSFGPGRSENIYGGDTRTAAAAGHVSISARFNNKIKNILRRFDFFRFLEEKKLSFAVIAIGIAFAFIVGGAHALQPGHGKTLVAAYLVGTRGKSADALLLGLIVTLTHVAAVIVLFAVLIIFWNKLNPEKVYPWLGVGSGAVIIAMGVWIFYRNLTGKYIPHEHDEFGRHIHPAGKTADHHHHHEHGHDHHEHDHPHDHHHEHHDHEHVPAKAAAQEENVRFTDLLTLGVTGGIVPCPTAVMILFASVGLNRLIFGLVLTAAFSVGMAAVLIAIGLFVVKAKSFADGKITESRLPRILPYFSGALVALIGIGICVKGLRDIGLF